ALVITDAWVDHHVDDIAEQSSEHGKKAAKRNNAHDHGIIAANHGIVSEKPHSIEIEDALYQECAGKHERENRSDSRSDGNQRITKRLSPDGLLERKTLGDSGAHVILPQL